MAELKFLKKEAIASGWNAFKSQKGMFIGIVFISALFYIIPNFLQDNLKDAQILAALIGVAAWVLQSAIAMGMARVSLQVTDKGSSSVSELFSCFSLLLKYIAASVLYGLMVFIGMILLIVPGIIVAMRGQFFVYYIIDEGAGPIEALKKSFEITKGSVVNLLLLSLVTILLNIVGVLAIGLGIFVSIPITLVAYAFVYRKLNPVSPEEAFSPTEPAV
ncbi:MAG: hypothetical protein ABIB11_02315 [Candidatus Omnitrophota bacterium]